MCNIYKWFFLLSSLVLSACASQPQLGGGKADFTITELKQRAEMASYAGSHQEAVLNYQQILSKEPDNVEALLGMAESLLAVDQPQRAEIYLERVLKLEPKNPQAREARALSWLMQGDYEAAQKSLNNLVDDGIANWRVWNSLGVIADLFGNYTDSVSYYKKAIELYPESPTLHNNLGYSLIMDKKYTQAEEMLIKALRLSPSNPRIVNNLALSVAWQGQYDKAIEYLRRVMDEASANNNVGYVAYLRGEYGVAEELFRKAMRLSPSYYKRAASNLELTLEKKNNSIEQQTQ